MCFTKLVEKFIVSVYNCRYKYNLNIFLFIVNYNIWNLHLLIGGETLRKVEEKGKYSMLEMILVFTLIAIILGFAIIPSILRAREGARKVNDISSAKAIYTTVYEGLLVDKLDYPANDLFIVVEDSSEVSPGLNAEYRKSVLNYLHDNMSRVPYNTSLDKSKKFVIKITMDGEVEIYVGSYFGDRVYPNPNGVYQ